MPWLRASSCQRASPRAGYQRQDAAMGCRECNGRIEDKVLPVQRNWPNRPLQKAFGIPPIFHPPLFIQYHFWETRPNFSASLFAPSPLRWSIKSSAQRRIAVFVKMRSSLAFLALVASASAKSYSVKVFAPGRQTDGSTQLQPFLWDDSGGQDECLASSLFTLPSIKADP